MKYFKISATLGAIALVCALLIALINLVTNPVIETNDKTTELNTCKEIFDKYDESKSESKSGNDLSNKNEAIIKIIYAKDSDGKSLGTIYKVSGKNAYGTITFASTVNNHVLENYPSSESTDVHLGAYEKSNGEKVSSLETSKIDGIDVKCGATYGATLVKDLVKIAQNDAKEAN